MSWSFRGQVPARGLPVPVSDRRSGSASGRSEARVGIVVGGGIGAFIGEGLPSFVPMPADEVSGIVVASEEEEIGKV